MIRYIIKRLLWMIPVVLGITVFIFMLMHLVPGDPAQLIAGPAATEEQLEATREAFGLNKPLLVQLGNYMSDLFFHGDMGTSFATSSSITVEVLGRLPRTLALGLCSIVISSFLGILLGVTAAVHQNRWPDSLCMVVSMIGVSVPAFWLALMLVLLFAVKLSWLPASGIGSIEYYIMPVLASSLSSIGGLARQTRSSMLEVIRSDYVVTARSKGLTAREVTYKHALPNALIPVVTMVGAQFGFLLGGSLVVELIFGIPGMGVYMVNGINNRDYAVVQSCVILIGIVFSLCMLVVDLLYAFIDPRIKAQYTKAGKKKGGKAK